MAHVDELRSLVHQHCIFFDRLVELVPAKFYIAREERENTWHYGMSKAAKAAAKQATKENLKKARRDRLDPEKFTSTVKLLEQHEKSGTESAEVEEEAEHKEFKGDAGRAVTYEELRERLHKRIEMLRAKRHADAAAAIAKNARNWQNEKKKDSQKQKRKKVSIVSNDEASRGMPSSKRQKQDIDTGYGTGRKEPADATTEFEFGRVRMGSSSDIVGGRPKRGKESKENLLTKATKLKLAMQDPEKGQEVAQKHSWSAAVSRAAGQKVFDDPKLLKRSMKKEQQQRQKSSKKWKERKETVEASAETKQQSRSEHIWQRVEQKKERRIAKREKKLLRPGFEGRKAGFINA